MSWLGKLLGFNDNTSVEPYVYEAVPIDIVKVGDFEHPAKPAYPPERLMRSDFMQEKHIPGKYGGNIADYEDVYYTCPGCSAVHDIKFSHGDTWKCGCGLYAQSYGNNLSVW